MTDEAIDRDKPADSQYRRHEPGSIFAIRQG
jgi:hypothetical protein